MTDVQAVLRQAGTQWSIVVPDGTAEAVGWQDGQVVTVTNLGDELHLELLHAGAAASRRASTIAEDPGLNTIDAASSSASAVSPSEVTDLAGRAKDQLALVLSFFARVETKLSVVLAVDLAMISIAFAKILPLADVSLSVIVWIGIFAAMQIASLILLYRGSFPHLRDGERSLIYFRTVAQMTEADYRSRFSQRPLEAHVDDVIDQVWINARILTVKFDRLKRAYFWMGLSVAPWIIALAVLALTGAR